MLAQKNGEGKTILAGIQAYIKNRAPEKQLALIQAFTERFYASCSVDDLTTLSIATLGEIALSEWNCIYRREKHQAIVRIFNPDRDTHGWESPHTVIQISHDDVPFIVDSARMAINRYGYEIHFIVHFGGLKVIRDHEHQIATILPQGASDEQATSEAPVYIEIDRIIDPALMTQLQQDIERVLNDVTLAVTDWRKMVGRVEECLSELENNPPQLDAAELAESRDFLRWLISNNFTFLGARDYKLIGDGTNRALQVVPETGLGVLRVDTQHVVSKSYSELPPQARKMALSKNILIIAKTNTTSTVHREAYTDYIGVKRFNEKGELIGERRFIGLYTSTAYHSSPRQIPFLRHKVDTILHTLGFPPDSHDGKEAVHILETLPRDDLFQATQEELCDLTLAIIQLKERKRIRLLVRRDAYDRYFSCLVFVPREIFTTDLAVAMQEILMQSFKGLHSSFSTYFSDSNLARIHYLIRINPQTVVSYDLASIEKWLIAVARSFNNELKDALITRFGEAEGLRYYSRYNKAFSASYTECYTPREAISDIEKMEALTSSEALGMLFTTTQGSRTLNMKLFHVDHTIVLSDVLPILENMGLRIIGERSHEVKFKDGKRIWINDFSMSPVTSMQIDIHDVEDIFQEAFKKIWYGDAENDGFNRLVLESNLTWHETAMLRAYAKYLRQIGFNLSQNYIEQALINHTGISKALVQLFTLRFDPHYQRQDKSAIETLCQLIQQSLDSVASLDEDRILRRLYELIHATLRTNYFQTNEAGEPKPYLALKFDPEQISDLPLPRPKYEIFVYSPRVEGIHLRAGKVARGGLRWSDRREDFRTEVLGLMKAQQVKNTVIVPVGAKGGFVVKKPQSADMTRDEYMREVVDCYSTFISGLLDITDNIKDGVVIPPTQVVRLDEEDPYLVVAADKGTATFSDIANGIAARYDFWLGDAFASGGSAGYDHKKMGITSRGAWVSVSRHFRELGLNPATDDFTVIGIGDMSGDVFGNGLLMSDHIKLLGAFNHMHIFLDPNPNPATSYEERKRLFALPRSSWEDYNPALISPGGGVFSRSAKSIKLSNELKQMLNTDKDSLVPNELIRALLKAPADLIWNGGIGTFVKASHETHADVGDRASDAIRVDASELQARVIAEGGNLGMTQLARIEYSLHGGIVNTDFIDNSAGVDCSDHEVNIKILFNNMIANGRLTREERNVILEKMTEEVAELVLTDNYDQTLMLSLEASVSTQTLELFRHYMNDMEKQGRLNRHLEYLPDDQSLLERKVSNKPLTRPEIAMLLAYSKMYLKQDILASSIPEEPYFLRHLLTAFPKPLRDNYLEELKEHSLRREIIATQLCKSITDRMGINFIERLHRETGASSEFIIRAYAIAEAIFNMESLWQQIAALDYKINTDIQYRMMLQLFYLIRRSTRWLLRNRKHGIDIQATIDEFASSLQYLIVHLPDLLDAHGKEVFNASVAFLDEENVPAALSKQVAACNTLFTALDIIEGAKKYNIELVDMAKAYYHLGNRLDLNWIRELMDTYVVNSQWDELARAGFRDDLDRVQRKLAGKVLTLKSKDAKSKTIEERIELWISRTPFLMARWSKLLADIRSSEVVDFVTYSVVLRELFDFVQAT